MEDKFSHIDKRGAASMVDVSAKASNARVARAAARVRLGAMIVNLLREGAVAKGDVLAAARIAGIQAAKKTSELIPLCHLLPLDKVGVEFEFEPETVVITSTCKCSGKTGVEMEALTAVSVAALTIYDMCKSLDKAIVIEDMRLLEKSGGKSGHWRADAS